MYVTFEVLMWVMAPVYIVLLLQLYFVIQIYKEKRTVSVLLTQFMSYLHKFSTLNVVDSILGILPEALKAHQN